MQTQALHESIKAGLSASATAIVPLSVRLPKAMHDALRKIAFDRRVSIHSLILAGIDKVIVKNGQGIYKK